MEASISAMHRWWHCQGSDGWCADPVEASFGTPAALAGVITLDGVADEPATATIVFDQERPSVHPHRPRALRGLGICLDGITRDRRQAVG